MRVPKPKRKFRPPLQARPQRSASPTSRSLCEYEGSIVIPVVHHVNVGRWNPVRHRKQRVNPLTSLIVGDLPEAIDYLFNTSNERENSTDLTENGISVKMNSMKRLARRPPSQAKRRARAAVHFRHSGEERCAVGISGLDYIFSCQALNRRWTAWVHGRGSSKFRVGSASNN